MATIRLGLDASQPLASCAISIENEIVASVTLEKPIENFPTLIRETLTQAHINLEDLNEIVACVGPGSQTGVRTAVVTGNVLARALGIPIWGVLSTDAAAQYSETLGSFSVAVSAGRSRFYVSTYNYDGDVLQRTSEPELYDQLPSDAFFAFKTTSDVSDKSVACACGALLIAAKQQTLVLQSTTHNEITPYEGGLQYG